MTDNLSERTNDACPPTQAPPPTKGRIGRMAGICFLGAGLLVLLLLLVASVLESMNLYVYIGGHISMEWMPVALWSFFLLLCVGAVLFFFRRVVFRILCVLLIVLIWGFWGMILLFAAPYYTYTELTSPELGEETHELVFVETAVFPFGGDGYAYEKVAPGLVRKLGDYYADDAAMPVHHDYYDIDWRDDGFTLHACGYTTDFFFAD